jgi:uncharacterized membrane protein (DUF4010 family)
MLPWLVGGLLAGALYLLCLYRGLENKVFEMPALDVRNPAELKTAFAFSLAFVVVLLLVAWMNDIFSDTGVYVVAFISGLTDLDAITISNLKLVSAGTIEPGVAVNAVVIAFIANLIFKFGIVYTVADNQLRRPILRGFVCLAAGSLLGILVTHLI